MNCGLIANNNFFFLYFYNTVFLVFEFLCLNILINFGNPVILRFSCAWSFLLFQRCRFHLNFSWHWNNFFHSRYIYTFRSYFWTSFIVNNRSEERRVGKE